MSEEKTISTRTVYEGWAIKVRVDEILKADGKTTTRDIVEHADVIVAIPFDEFGRVIMVRQYRHAVGKELLELPAGGIDPGESPEDAVRRELQEEIGFLPETIEPLGGFYAAPGYSTEYLYLFSARDLKRSQLVAEDTDGIKTERLPLAEAPARIASGEIQDSKSIAGLLKYICLGGAD